MTTITRTTTDLQLALRSKNGYDSRLLRPVPNPLVRFHILDAYFRHGLPVRAGVQVWYSFLHTVVHWWQTVRDPKKTAAYSFRTWYGHFRRTSAATYKEDASNFIWDLLIYNCYNCMATANLLFVVARSVCHIPVYQIATIEHTFLWVPEQPYRRIKRQRRRPLIIRHVAFETTYPMSDTFDHQFYSRVKQKDLLGMYGCFQDETHLTVWSYLVSREYKRNDIRLYSAAFRRDVVMDTITDSFLQHILDTKHDLDACDTMYDWASKNLLERTAVRLSVDQLSVVTFFLVTYHHYDPDRATHRLFFRYLHRVRNFMFTLDMPRLRYIDPHTASEIVAKNPCYVYCMQKPPNSSSTVTTNDRKRKRL